MQDCGHRMCKDCFAYHLQTQLTDGAKCVQTTCPEDGCGLLVPLSMFEELLSAKEFEKVQGFAVNTYIEKCKDTKFCPGVGCTSFLEKKTTNALYNVNCHECETSSCFGCS